MKKLIQALAVVLFITSGFCMGSQVYTYNHASNWCETPADYSIVNAIKAKSDLSQADVDKFKLLFLGGLQNVAAAGIGSYAAYKAGEGTYGGLDMLGSYAPSDNNKFLWALAGAAGVGFGAYKLLYPRIEAGVLSQVKTFIDMCENLDIYNYRYRSFGDLASLGTHNDKYTDWTQKEKVLYNSAWSSTNAAWLTPNNIARLKALNNLLEQCRAAIGLIAELESRGNVATTQGLRDKANGILHLLNENNINYQTLMAKAQLEAQERKNDFLAGRLVVQQGLQLEQSKANVEATKEQVSASRYKKVSLASTALMNFVEKSFKTLVYVNDKKYEIAGGVLAVILLPSLVSKTVQAWYFGQ